MGKYRDLGVDLDRQYRNDLNANFTDIDTDVQAQKARVDNLITGTPQPSEIVDARGGFTVLSERLGGVDASLAEKANQSYVDTQISAVASGSPKGTYATLAALQTAFPTGNTNIYLVTADGKWYYWNGSAWTAGGTYQSTGLSDGIVTEPKLLATVNNRIYNSNYKVDADFGNVFVNGSIAEFYIKTLRVFLQAGEVAFSITNQTFTLERNTTLYIDMAEATPTIKKALNIPHSGATFGAGAFFNDKKILLLANVYDIWVGTLADNFELSRQRTRNEKLLVAKIGADNFVYAQSPSNYKKYARYKIEYKDVPYSSTDSKSNVKVHTINGVQMMTRKVDNTFQDDGQIVLAGAWDMAMREASTSDGVGGIAHGDEIETMFQVKVNGDFASATADILPYDTIEFIGGSDLFRDTATYPTPTKLATHFKSFLFTKDRLTMTSKIKMERQATLTYCYLAMCPISKDFTNKAFSDIDVMENDLTVTSPIHTEKKDVKRVVVYGDTVTVDTKVIEKKTSYNENTKVEEVVYNKVYYDLVTTNDVVPAGEVLSLTTEFVISIA